MSQLTERQTQLVLQQLRSHSNDTIIAIDLEDHICCVIEEKLELGQTFEQAFKEAFSLFNATYIDDLNQATIFLTKTNIIMTTKTIITGIAGFALCLLALIGKNLDISGSNEVLVIGTAVMIFGFFLSNVLNVNKSLQIKQIKIINWLGFIGVAGVLVGTLFRILKYYSFSTSFLIAGGVFLMIYFIASTFKMKALAS